jgi:hypothetical protein
VMRRWHDCGAQCSDVVGLDVLYIKELEPRAVDQTDNSYIYLSQSEHLLMLFISFRPNL